MEHLEEQQKITKNTLSETTKTNQLDVNTTSTSRR